MKREETIMENKIETTEVLAEKPAKKPFPKWILIAAPIVLVVIVVLVLIAAGVFRSDKTKVLLAFANTFKEQPKIMEDMKLDDISKWAAEKKITTNIVMDGVGEAVDMSLAIMPEEVRYFGEIEGEYLPETDFVVSYTNSQIKAMLPAVSDVLFVYNYTEMPSGELFDDADEESIEILNDLLSTYWTEENTNLEKRLNKAVKKAFKEVEVNKTDSAEFRIDDKKRNCDGYEFVLSDDFFLDLLDEVETIYEEELEEEVYESMEDVFDAMRQTFREFPESEVKVYIYKNKLACVEVVMDEADIEMELLFKGGKFRWQNMELVVDDGYEEINIELEGKTDGKEEEYELSVEGTDILTLEYSQKTGDFVIESDMEDFEFEGNIVSEKTSVCISFAVEGVDMAVTISQGANLENIEGEEFNIGTASEDDFLDVMEENEELMELLEELL